MINKIKEFMTGRTVVNVLEDDFKRIKIIFDKGESISFSMPTVEIANRDEETQQIKREYLMQVDNVSMTNVASIIK